jgi:hypothetical protein
MADEGSQQILDLLNQPSEPLNTAGLALAKALRRAPKEPYGVPPQYGFDALADIRQYYRDLRAQIDAIDSADPSKQDTLDALDALDRTFGGFERGLSQGVTKDTVRKLKRSDKNAGSAKKALRAALKGLST